MQLQTSTFFAFLLVSLTANAQILTPYGEIIIAPCGVRSNILHRKANAVVWVGQDQMTALHSTHVIP